MESKNLYEGNWAVLGGREYAEATLDWTVATFHRGIDLRSKVDLQALTSGKWGKAVRIDLEARCGGGCSSRRYSPASPVPARPFRGDRGDRDLQGKLGGVAAGGLVTGDRGPGTVAKVQVNESNSEAKFSAKNAVVLEAMVAAE